MMGLITILNGERDTGFEHNISHPTVSEKGVLLKSRLQVNFTKPYCAT